MSHRKQYFVTEYLGAIFKEARLCEYKYAFVSKAFPDFFLVDSTCLGIGVEKKRLAT